MACSASTAALLLRRPTPPSAPPSWSVLRAGFRSVPPSPRQPILLMSEAAPSWSCCSCRSCRRALLRWLPHRRPRRPAGQFLPCLRQLSFFSDALATRRCWHHYRICCGSIPPLVLILSVIFALLGVGWWSATAAHRCLLNIVYSIVVVGGGGGPQLSLRTYQGQTIQRPVFGDILGVSGWILGRSRPCCLTALAYLPSPAATQILLTSMKSLAPLAWRWRSRSSSAVHSFVGPGVAIFESGRGGAADPGGVCGDSPPVPSRLVSSHFNSYVLAGSGLRGPSARGAGPAALGGLEPAVGALLW